MTVIVAIPAKEDRVWELSSEKVPHLTLLFLGDRLNNQGHVKNYIEHAVNTSLSRFYLDVERRGTLGDQSADVLFFGKHLVKPLIDFRRNLLTNTDILAAYNSVEQFPTWTPHLTMGYPETPAKPDTREYPGLHAVGFDRIALWTGDYEGVEFPLKTEEVDLSMADKGVEFLSHYGIKGMKWGIRRANPSGEGSTGGSQNKSGVVDLGKAAVKAHFAPSKDAKKATQYMVRAKLGGVRNLNNQEMQLVIQRMQLEKQYKELYGERQWTTKGAKWAGDFVTNVGRDVASSWLSNPFARKRESGSPVRTQAWTNGQDFARMIEGDVGRRAIGS